MINYISVEKDYDDIKITVEFNREEWLAINRFISLAYGGEEIYRNLNINVDLVKKMYDNLNNMKDDVF